MNSYYLWSSIIPLSIGTFLIRSSFIFLSDKLKLNDEIKLLFSYIPASVLPALLGPMVYFHKGEIDFFNYHERLIAFLFGCIICFYTKNIFLTIIAGLLGLYFLRLQFL